MIKDFFVQLFTVYRTPLRVSIFLFLGGCFYVWFASPAVVHTPPYLHEIFIVFIVLFLGDLLFFLRQNHHYDPLSCFVIALFPLALVFALVVPLIDAVIPFLPFITGFSGLFLGGFWVLHRLIVQTLPIHTPSTAQTSSHTLSSTSRRIGVIFVTVCTLFFLFVGLYHIGQQTLVDEPLWAFNRVERYWHNMLDGDFRHTRPSDKPGVSVAFLSGAALLSFPSPSELKDTITPEVRQQLLSAMRIPLVLFVALLLPFFYHVTRTLFDKTIARIYLALLVLSPLLLGMSRMINPDALLWGLIPLTLLSFFATLTTHKKSFLISTGVLFGLALLTKYVANILFVFFPLSIFLYHLFTISSSTTPQATRNTLQLHGKFYALIILIALFVFVLFLPSTWVHPVHLLTGTLWSQAFAPLWKLFLIVLSLFIVDLYMLPTSLVTSLLTFFARYKKIILYAVSYGSLLIILYTIVTAHLGQPFDYQLALRSPKSALSHVGPLATFFADYYVLIFGIHPIALFATLYALAILPRYHTLKQTPVWLIILLIFIPFYYIGALFGDVAATMRYQISLYPLILLLAAYGLQALLKPLSQWWRRALFLIILLALITSLFRTAPFYQSYASIFLPRGDLLTIKDMGDGSYQAAQWLNNLPHANELSVWADKSGVCAAFVGHCTTTVDVTRIARDNLSFDYYVTSSGRQHLVTRNAAHKRHKKTAPPHPLRFDFLYTKNFTPITQIVLAHNRANTINIFSAKEISITP